MARLFLKGWLDPRAGLVKYMPDKLYFQGTYTCGCPGVVEAPTQEVADSIFQNLCSDCSHKMTDEAFYLKPLTSALRPTYIPMASAIRRKKFLLLDHTIDTLYEDSNAQLYCGSFWREDARALLFPDGFPHGASSKHQLMDILLDVIDETMNVLRAVTEADIFLMLDRFSFVDLCMYGKSQEIRNKVVENLPNCPFPITCAVFPE